MVDEIYSRLRLALFVTWVVDLMRPSVGFSAVKLLEAVRCNVTVPERSSCCGQPAYSLGA
jgi:L-lactate dehydrogenase complex protein LldE